VNHQHERAFLEAFDAYADALFRHACLRLSDRERAKDTTQDTFIKAWDYLVGGHEVREWRSFLYRVLNNLIIDEYRRTKELSLDALIEDTAGDTAILTAPEGRREKEESFDIAYAVERIRLLIAELPEPHRGTLILRYVDGLTPREIAAALDISENAAAVRIHRAVARLRALCAERNLVV
jgi:RNA polymerase sigma-70 factor (ECF subfamily)